MTALRHKRKMSGDVFVLNLIAYTFCGLVALLCLVPFIIIVSSSLSSEEAVLQNGFSLLPPDFSLQAYETVFREPMVVFRAYATTGDGQLTALQVLSLLKESGKKASELFGACARYPQVLINVPVADNDVKKAVMASQALWDAVKAEEEQLAGSGRILVRPSGTEALMRVMVEAKTEDVARQTAQRLAQMIPSLAKE